jgi:hypothetical protein
MWTWEQVGRLLDKDGNFVSSGYSGAEPDGKNNPDLQEVHAVGPIPRGLYTIHPPYDTATHGPYVLPLTPDDGNEMFGRGGFLIHGDSIHNPGTASLGCIVLPRLVRRMIWESGDHQLQVVKG